MIKIFENTPDKRLPALLQLNLKSFGNLDKDAGYYLKQLSFPTPDYIAIQLQGKEVLGWFAFDIDEKTKCLYDNGVYVVSKSRGSHLALDLWETAFKRFDVKQVEVETVSASGKSFVKALRGKYPQIKWIVF
jgi:hypothetical protein